MRNLTIKRIKSFVGCLGKVKIYIEDPTSSEIVINGVSCRKLGEIKNGNEATFQIENNALKVFAIFDKLSKNYCNDFYELCEGEEDIYLSGQCRFSLGSNAFRFDNNPSQSAAANRKKGNKKGVLILIVAIIVGGLVGFASTSLLYDKSPKEKKFSSKGMNITLTENFKKTSAFGFTTAFDSKDVAILALQEEFSVYEGLEDYSLKEYAKTVIENNDLDVTKIKSKKGLTYFEYYYTNEETNDIYHYYSFVYKTKDSFWLIQFALLDENTQKEEDNVFKWAKSVNFDN